MPFVHIFLNYKVPFLGKLLFDEASSKLILYSPLFNSAIIWSVFRKGCSLQYKPYLQALHGGLVLISKFYITGNTGSYLVGITYCTLEVIYSSSLYSFIGFSSHGYNWWVILNNCLICSSYSSWSFFWNYKFKCVLGVKSVSLLILC